MTLARIARLSRDASEIGETFTELKETIARGLHYLMLRALNDPDEAQDGVQETLARAVEAIRLGQLPPGVPLGAFVHGIARHVIADTYRRRARSRGESGTEDLSIPSPDPDPLQQLITNEKRDRVQRALAKLGFDDRGILTDYFVHGLRLTTIAEREGVPPATIRKRKSRALARFRVLLTEGQGHIPSLPPTSVA